MAHRSTPNPMVQTPGAFPVRESVAPESEYHSDIPGQEATITLNILLKREGNNTTPSKRFATRHVQQHFETGGVKMKNYIALFEENGKGGYGVVFPDFPGLISAGDNYDDAVRMAHEGLSGHVAVMVADGEPIPEPRSLEQIKREWEDWAEWEKEYKFVVGYVTLLPLKTRAKRVNVMIDEYLLSRIDRVTDNRSAFLSEAARRMLDT